MITCPICSAATLDLQGHLGWHEMTGTDGGFRLRRDVVDADDTPTAKLPPIRETVRRRPPVPEIRELSGRELILALAEQLDREERALSVTGDESPEDGEAGR